MADENKVEEKKEEKEEKKKGGEKNGEKKEEEPPEIVLRVDMHCKACARKVTRALKGFEGVEEVSADSKASKVVVKGKAADPKKVWERLQRKSGRKVDLISPLPKPPKEKNTEIKEPPKEKTPPAAVTVVLKVRMDCEACAQVIQKRIYKIQGVESVETDLANGQVIVKGLVDSTKLVDDVYKRTRKQTSIVKEEEKKAEKNEVEDKKTENDNRTDNIKRSEYGPSMQYVEFGNYTSQIFSDENPNACSVM